MEQVSVDTIDYQDRTFCISFPLLDDRLLASVKQFGVTCPLILLKPAPFRVVAGFKRLEAARILGIREVPCIAVSMDEREAVLVAVTDNISRPLNVVEKALSVEKMVAAGMEAHQIETVMRAMGVQPHEKVINLFIALAQSDEAIKTFAVTHNLGAQDVGLLLALPLEVRSIFFSVLAPLHLTSSLVREIIELAKLLSIKGTDIPFAEIEGLPNGDAVKEALKRKAYPLLTGLQEQMRIVKDAMHLPPQITVAADPYFEKSSIDIRITARNEGEVRELMEKLKLATESGQIRSIFDLVSGKSDRN
jgi:hypothetical protein